MPVWKLTVSCVSKAQSCCSPRTFVVLIWLSGEWRSPLSDPLYAVQSSVPMLGRRAEDERCEEHPMRMRASGASLYFITKPLYFSAPALVVKLVDTLS